MPPEPSSLAVLFLCNFSDKVSHFERPRVGLGCDLPIYASIVAGIIGKSYRGRFVG